MYTYLLLDYEKKHLTNFYNEQDTHSKSRLSPFTTRVPRMIKGASFSDQLQIIGSHPTLEKLAAKSLISLQK